MAHCQAFLQKSLHFMVLNLNDYVLVTCQWILMKFSVNDTQIYCLIKTNIFYYLIINFGAKFCSYLESIFKLMESH